MHARPHWARPAVRRTSKDARARAWPEMYIPPQRNSTRKRKQSPAFSASLRQSLSKSQVWTDLSAKLQRTTFPGKPSSMASRNDTSPACDPSSPAFNFTAPYKLAPSPAAAVSGCLLRCLREAVPAYSNHMQPGSNMRRTSGRPAASHGGDNNGKPRLTRNFERRLSMHHSTTQEPSDDRSCTKRRHCPQAAGPAPAPAAASVPAPGDERRALAACGTGGASGPSAARWSAMEMVARGAEGDLPHSACGASLPSPAPKGRGPSGKPPPGGGSPGGGRVSARFMPSASTPCCRWKSMGKGCSRLVPHT
mmetsp:Transcript_47460/g.144454  ORF Transcript_47460/g.144454 Transcript_47460/m.144454 type:complete len:307 (-) Transcript_47460:237-1157(-)